eukprot:Polyplicarium_translucidae@DN2309_c0_g1_i1.p1
MHATKEALDHSSKTLDVIDGSYGLYATHLARGAKVVASIRKRAESDTRLLVWTFAVFCTSCGFVVGKRLKLLRIVFTLLRTVLWFLTTGASAFSSPLKSAALYEAASFSEEGERLDVDQMVPRIDGDSLHWEAAP